jgi:hypothetical protein
LIIASFKDDINHSQSNLRNIDPYNPYDRQSRVSFNQQYSQPMSAYPVNNNLPPYQFPNTIQYNTSRPPLFDPYGGVNKGNLIKSKTEKFNCLLFLFV